MSFGDKELQFNASKTVINPATLEKQQEMIVAGKLVPEQFDEVALAYNPDDSLATATYKLATVTVATLTLTWTAGKLTGVVKT